jgi:hypothetical protein
VIGKVYNIPPQPPDAKRTHEFAAGAVTFGVEYRDVDPDALRATYAGNAAHLAELEEKSPAGGFFDAGVSIHVSGSDDGYEYLRFDCFDDEPHYHYVHRTEDGSVQNQVIDFDTVAGGDMIVWTINCLHDRLSAMLTSAGGAAVAARLDPSVVGPALDDVERTAMDARARHRAAQGTQHS